MTDQFDLGLAARPERIDLAPGAALLPGFALPFGDALLRGIESVIRDAPFRHMNTPQGYRMSVAMTNCGPLGWITDRRGYRYTAQDPDTGEPWPEMPPTFRTLATQAAARVGFDGFDPDACLINRYDPGARLSLHQDRDEHDYDHPIVSVSLGLPATFQFGGPRRTDRPARVPLVHGDVVVWGGPTRLHFHGVLPLKPGEHPRLGACRINLTFRQAG